MGHISKNAAVKVDETTKNGKTSVKFATAHDFRRAFGTRWASRVMPADLQRLMRHASIEITMKSYVNQGVSDISARLYASMGSGNSSSNTHPNEQKESEPQNVIR